MTLEIIILAALILGGIILAASYFHKRLGMAIWSFMLILLPSAIILIIAEAEVAQGALAMMVGSVSGAYGIAIMIALGMLLCAHWFGDCLIDYFNDDRDFGAATYNGETWRPSRISVAGLAFLFFAVVYGILGYVRTGFTASLLGPGSIPVLGRFVFFLYPVVSLLIGFFTAQAIRSMKHQLERWNRSQNMCLTAKVAMAGKTSNDECKRILRMLESHALNHDNPSEALKETTDQLEKYKVLAPVGLDASALPYNTEPLVEPRQSGNGHKASMKLVNFE